MAQNKSSKESEKPTTTSAPELPADIAKQFGLHHLYSEANELDRKVINEKSFPSNQGSIADDSKTDEAVDDILAKESDELLASQDATNKQSEPAKKRGFWHKVGHFFVAWWCNRWARWITILLIVAATTTVAVMPKARYAVLNGVGVRSSASVVVLDNTTQLPLKNVTVQLGDKETKTDVKGVAKLSDLKLGTYNLTIKRLAFASHEQEITIGWGSNPLGTYKLRATGIQYVFFVNDYLSGKPVSSAEINNEQFNALSDKNGKVVLTVEDTEVTTYTVAVQAAGYRRESITLDAANPGQPKIALVPQEKAVFVSRQSGKFDVYTMDLDGKNKKVVLPGTGNESSNMSLVVSPDNEHAALVSTRDDLHDKDGYRLFALTIIDLKEGVGATVDHAQQIQLIDWLGDRLIYRTTLAGASGADPQRNRLVSFNFESNARMQLATANQFNMISSASGNIYFAASGTDPQATMGLFRIKPDGSSRKRLSETEVWTGVRATYNTFNLQTPDGWYGYDLKNDKLAKINNPASTTSYTFADDTKTKRSVWIDTRDGKGALLLYDINKGSNATLRTQEGLTIPFRWVGDKALVYRVVTSSEAADYVVSPNGGSARKLTDVTPTYGYSPAY